MRAASTLISFALALACLGACELGDETATDDGVTDDGDVPGTIAMPGKRKHLNLWTGAHYAGPRYSTQQTDDNIGARWHNVLSSAVNKMDIWWTLYEFVGFEGYAVCVRPHSFVSNMDDYRHPDPTGGLLTWDNRIDSVHRGSSFMPYQCNQVIGRSIASARELPRAEREALGISDADIAEALRAVE